MESKATGLEANSLIIDDPAAVPCFICGESATQTKGEENAYCDSCRIEVAKAFDKLKKSKPMVKSHRADEIGGRKMTPGVKLLINDQAYQVVHCGAVMICVQIIGKFKINKKNLHKMVSLENNQYLIASVTTKQMMLKYIEIEQENVINV